MLQQKVGLITNFNVEHPHTTWHKATRNILCILRLVHYAILHFTLYAFFRITRSFSGLITDEHARVLNAQQQPINGLYAIGNDMSSVMRGFYPSGGITLGPAMTFVIWLGNNCQQKERKASIKS